MPSTILVPLDGSPLSEEALEYAVRFARDEQVRIVLARVVSAGSDAQALDAAQTYLERVADHWGSAALNVETRVLRGSASAELVSLASTLPAELVVLSTHGRSGVGRSIYGSVADDVVRRATTPVVLVPNGALPPWAAEQPPKILVTLDGSELAEAILEPIQRLAAVQRAELALLQVIEWPPPAAVLDYGGTWYGIDPDRDLKEGRAYVESVAQRLRPSVASVTTRVGLGRMPDRILEVAREEHVNLIGMATHGRGGLTRLVMGGTAADVVQRADVPLLLVRPLPTAAPSIASTAPDQPADTVVSVRLTQPDLVLVERGLNALLYGPHAIAERQAEIENLRERCRQRVTSPIGNDAARTEALASG
jgi:nucleotide-binding universal stress UspA family protein